MKNLEGGNAIESATKTCENKAFLLRHGSKQSRIDVISSILEKSNGPTSETKLLHVCDLNVPQFRLYRTFLVDTGLLKACEQEEGVDLFETTERGREFLRDYAGVKALLSSDLKREKGGDR